MQRLNDHYVAGLFDGEGWFSVNRGRRKDVRRGYSFQVHAAIAMKERALVKALSDQWGGCFLNQTSRSDKHAPYYRWVVTGEGAATFAARIGPLLQVKRRQAALVERFQSIKRLNSKNAPLTDRQYARLERMWLRMKIMNKRGPTS